MKISQERALKTLEALAPELSPQLRKAAVHVIKHPERVALGTVRQVAEESGVHPNALVKLARLAGFDGYREFRQTFALHLKHGAKQFRGRAQALQKLATGKAHNRLYADIASTALDNIESLYSGNDAESIRRAAEAIVKAQTAYVLGVGAGYALAHNFWYMAHMALQNVVQIPRPGNLPIDDLSRIGTRDVLIAINFHPYRTDVVAAVELARKRKATLIAITDNRLSPIAISASHVFVTPADSPQFFTSIISAAALMETLLSFIIADADRTVLKHIETFHKVRYDSGVYIEDE